MKKKLLKGRLLKNTVCFVLALAMVITLLPFISISAKAEESTLKVGDCDLLVPSAATISDEGKDQSVTSITSDTTTLSSGWYIVDSDVTTTNLSVSGDVNIILKDGCTLTANAESSHAGINVSGTNSLTIWCQSGGTGNLSATGGYEGAGIGGGINEFGNTITINGGNIIATGGDWGAGIGSGYGKSGNTITINGGTVTATGGYHGAGIGSGYNGPGNTITINGGTVTATGGYYEAGIGGAFYSENNITINGGTVTATGGSCGAGIGGASDKSKSNITIVGGNVTATGGDYGAGIGGGCYDSENNITINGGTVTATGGFYGAGIGDGYEGSSSAIIISTAMTTKADNTNPPVTVINNDGSDLESNLSDKAYVYIEPIKYKVTFDSNGGSEVDSAEVIIGNTVTEPDDPTKTPYIFGGWYKDNSCTEPWNFKTETVSQNTTLYAKWITYAKSFHWGSDCKTCEITYTSVFDSSVTETYDCIVTECIRTPATCTSNGTTTYTAVYGDDSESKDVEDIPAGHTLTRMSAKAATSSSSGNEEYYSCSACGKLFLDAAGATETTLADVTIAELKTAGAVTLLKTVFTYNGKVQKPSVTAKDSDGKTISSSCYDVTYAKGCVNPGVYKVTVTFKGTYTGQKTLTFKINQASNPMKLKKTSVIMKYSSLQKKATAVSITFSKKAQGKVTYTLSKTAKKAGIKVSSKGKITVPKKCKKGTYKITVKAAGNRKYKTAGKTFIVKVK